MRRHPALLAAILFCCLSSFSQAPDTVGLIAEADVIAKQGERAFMAGRFDEAIELAKKDLAIRVKIGDSRSIGAANFNVGVIFREKRDYKKSIVFLTEALRHYTIGYGRDNPKSYLTEKQIARVYVLMERHSEALEHTTAARKTAESLFGKSSKEAAEMTLAIARIYESMHRPQDAADAFYSAILLNDKISDRRGDYDRQDVDAFMCFSLRTEFFLDFDKELSKLSAVRTNESESDMFRAGILNERAIKLARPILTPNAEKLMTYKKTTVPVRILLNSEGRVVAAKSICAAPQTFAEPALQAAYLSTFTPFTKNDKPARASGLIIYTFGR